MAELIPVPFSRLLGRAHHEFARSRAIFDLPARRFYRPAGDLNLSVPFGGSVAANPIGPAAGPQTQLAQNIALCWLAGARIVELKTIQVVDEMRLSRPCIDMATVGYNTEWSQELTLEQSAREYVKASMLVELLEASGVIGGAPGPTVFDLSVGYDLAGIRSGAVVGWLDTMRDASAIVEELRREIPAEFVRWRDRGFRTEISRSITLSTFHGTPAGEIERIGEFLVGELGFHLIVKLNPPMLGRERLEFLLHDVLGYREIEVNPGCYEHALDFDEAVGIIRRLQTAAAKRGLTVGIKCGNTLEVRNRGSFLKEPVQYLSGQPLHALHLALAARWRNELGGGLPISFSAGVDAANVGDCVAAGFAAVTACTDLLRPGGYGRMARYLANLEAQLRARGARTIQEFVARSDERAQPGAGDATLHGSIVRNTERLLARALDDTRYRADRNRKPPRKVGSQLWLWDCLNCDKCIPVCPNDANFQIEVEPFAGASPVLEVDGAGWREVGRRRFAAGKRAQIATFADACNDCGNCDVFCPEDGGPYVEKPRFFGSLEAWERASPADGFVFTREEQGVVLRGRFGGDVCVLRVPAAGPTVSFTTGSATLEVDWNSHRPLSGSVEGGVTARVDMWHYHTMRLLAGALLRQDRVNFVNAPCSGSGDATGHGHPSR